MQPAQPTQRPSIAPVAIGIVILGITLLILGRVAAARRNAPTETLPAIELLSPAADTTATTPLVLVFDPNAELRLHPTGWGAGRNHLHVKLNDTEIMPGARDIEDLGNGRYRWTVQAAPGTYRLQMVWSGPDHRPLPDGRSQTRQVIIQ